jgi:hypothetical protein
MDGLLWAHPNAFQTSITHFLKDRPDFPLFRVIAQFFGSYGFQNKYFRRTYLNAFHTDLWVLTTGHFYFHLEYKYFEATTDF